MTLPMRQYSISKQEQDNLKPAYEELHRKAHMTYYGVPNKSIPRSMLGDSEEEREANLERLWGLSGFSFWGAFSVLEHN